MPDLRVSDADTFVAFDALGPGDDDPRVPARGEAAAIRGPLGPGEDDPRYPAKGEAGPIRGPLGPGELDGPDPHEGFTFLAPAPAGPGGAQTGPRHLTRVPQK